ncbi:MAG: T9SS type A sorting domain-containing protein [Bacteroidia bacterium]|jgi:hypothetical protein
MHYILYFIFMLGGCSFLQAQFTSDTLNNLAVHDIVGSEQATPLKATTSDGKTYISWFDISSGSYVLRMQLLDANGVAQWPAGGVVVSNYPQSTALFRYDLKVDLTDHAIVAFQDERSGEMKPVVYRIAPDGSSVWGDAGFEITDSTATGLAPKIGITRSNNIIVAWNADADATRWLSYQKISPSGQLLWSKRIFDGNKYSRPCIAPRDTDGFIMMYVKETGNFPGVTCTMLAQAFDSNGIGQWSNPITVSTKTITFFFFPEITPDEAGGFYIGFNSGNPVNATLNDVYVQHVDSLGNTWSATGVEAANSTTEFKSFAGLIFNESLQHIFVQLQVLDGSQSASGISIQKLNASDGALLFAANALVIKSQDPEYYLPYGIADAGDGIIGIYGLGGFGNQHLQAYKIDYSGASSWSYDPTLCLFNSNKDDVAVGPFKNEQCVVVWADDRNDLGIYAQNVRSDGNFGSETTGIETHDANSNIRIAYGQLQDILMLKGFKDMEVVMVEIISSDGRLVGIFDEKNSTQFQLPTYVHAGIYVIKVSSGNKHWSIKWVKR